MSPIFGIGLFAYCVRDNKEDEDARRKKNDDVDTTGTGTRDNNTPVFVPPGGTNFGGTGTGSSSAAALY